MNWFFNQVKSEPVMFQAVVQAAVALITGFGLHLTGEQIADIMAFTAAVLAFITRQHVTSNNNLSVITTQKQ